MDKYEFNIKVEQIKKLVNKSDYETAMKIADTIDWRRVRNTNLLSMIAQVYEKNDEYQEAKDILLLAYERAPIGKRLLYKLAELSLKEGNISEAEAYYREFCDLAGDDPRQHLLRYMILKMKNAPVDQLINSLEGYTSIELDEKWLYELAELYQKAGMQQQCVGICDRIMLMFGLGKYVDKAMELKLQYAPLTGYQMDLVENREKYEAKLKAVEEQFSGQGDPDEDEYEDDDEPIDSSVYEEELTAKMREAEVEEHLAEELSRMDVHEAMPEPDEDMGRTRVLDNIRDMKRSNEAAVGIESYVEDDEPVEEMTVEEEDLEEEFDPEAGVSYDEEPESVFEDEEEMSSVRNNLMIEALTPEKGLELAMDALKKIHQEQGTRHQIAKITGEKLNKRGLFASADKLAGKDLIVEQAGSLSQATLDELNELMTEDTSGMNVILIDSPKRIESLHRFNAGLAEKFECIGTNEEREVDVKTVSEALSKQTEAQEAMVKDIASNRRQEPRRVAAAPKAAPRELPQEELEDIPREVPVQAPARPVIAPAPRASEEPEEDNAVDDREMDLDEFAQYACKYAAEIDCNISGKSMLALYERIEIMEEDGVPLTKENAEVLIEEAADRAEKPSIGKLIKGVFSSKYDKDGLLILKEEHFID